MVKNWPLMKNPQFLSNSHETWGKWLLNNVINGQFLSMCSFIYSDFSSIEFNLPFYSNLKNLIIQTLVACSLQAIRGHGCVLCNTFKTLKRVQRQAMWMQAMPISGHFMYNYIKIISTIFDHLPDKQTYRSFTLLA